MADSIKMPVEASHIMMFARAIGDPNPVYYDEDAAKTTDAGHIVAPPTFPRAVAQFDPDYPLRPRPGEKWHGSGKTPSGEERSGTGTGILHAEQHFEYHRHLKPGDMLTVTIRDGAHWERQSKRAGRLLFHETIQEYRNQHGELLVTGRSVRVKTERPVEQG